MSGQCVSWMVVSSDTTRIDTEALVGDVLFLRRIRSIRSCVHISVGVFCNVCVPSVHN